MTDRKYRALIGLDRDGTLVHDPSYLGREPGWKEQTRILPGVIEGIKVLREIPGSRIAVCSNQAGVARGFFGTGLVDESNRYIAGLLRERGAEIDGWHYCPYVSEGYAKEKNMLDRTWVKETDERKPGTGMLRKDAVNAGMQLEDFEQVCFIGDKLSDVLTGINAGGIGIFLDNDDNKHTKTEAVKAREAMAEHEGLIFIAQDFLDAAQIAKIAMKLRSYH